MIDKHSKGARFELEAKKLLIEQGYLVDQKNWNRYASKDFYTLFDILAIKKDEVRLIQVKTNVSDFYKARKTIRKWMTDHDMCGIISFEVWLREPRKPWRMEVINNGK